MWEDGSGEDTTANKGYYFQRLWLKKSYFFLEKKPGDTHQLPPRVTPLIINAQPSLEATAYHSQGAAVYIVFSGAAEPLYEAP